MPNTTPPLRSDEKTTALAFLDGQRDDVLRAVEGVDEEQARRRLVPSLTTLGGIVKHLTDVERWWFQVVFAGEEHVDLVSSSDDRDADWRVEDDDTVAGIVAGYRAAIDDARTICETASFDDVSQRPRPRRGENVSLRWIVLHMIEETARHAGHMDILRELIDGATGDHQRE